MFVGRTDNCVPQHEKVQYMPTHTRIGEGGKKCFVPYYWHSVCKTSVTAVAWTLFHTSQLSNMRWSDGSIIKFRYQIVYLDLDSDPTGERLSPTELSPNSYSSIEYFWLTDSRSGIPTVSPLALEWLVELEKYPACYQCSVSGYLKGF